MTAMKRAFLLATTEKYVVTVINFVSLPILARLLAPEEFGVSVLGGAVIALSEAIREFGISGYLLKDVHLRPENVHTAFSINASFTLIFGLLIYLLAPWIASYFSTPDLSNYLHVCLFSFVLGPLCTTPITLLRRNLDFGRLALVGIMSTAVNAACVILFATLGFSYMSFAYASIAAALTGVCLGLYFYRDMSIFRLSFSDWQGFFSFGGYDTGLEILNRIWENLPFFLFGRLLGTDAVAVYQRSTLISNLPERVLLSALSNVYFPALTAQMRQGRKSKESFLTTLEYVAVVLWPALVILALLAHPIVLFLLGNKWLATVPLIHVVAAAMMLQTPSALTYPTLAAAGAIHQAFFIGLIYVPTAICVFSAAAYFGTLAACSSLFFLYAMKSFLTLSAIQKKIDVSWYEIYGALRKSAVVAAFTAIGPLAFIIAAGLRMDLSVITGFCAGLFGAVGYMIGLWFTGHPVMDLLGQLTQSVRRQAEARWQRL